MTGEGQKKAGAHTNTVKHQTSVKCAGQHTLRNRDVNEPSCFVWFGVDYTQSKQD